MNLPNRLTVLRMAMIPVFLLLFYLPGLPWGRLWALAVFAAASLTDLLDGRIARSRGLVTDFGKFMDPLADKLLVVSAMIGLMDVGMVHALVVIIIIAREFLVTSLRLVAAPKGIVIAADRWGKYKTASQMIWICAALLLRFLMDNLGASLPWAAAVNAALVAVVTALTVISGANYLWKNRKLFTDF